MTQAGELSEQERHKAEIAEQKAARLSYVNELHGEDDRWITVKVAARITGVTEAMANRWVTSGQIAMKGNPLTREAELVGEEGRTRQVRLSDVRKKRPVLYPALATETAINTLNLQDIPKEMARVTAEAWAIAEAHQLLLGKYSELLAAMEQWEVALREQGETFAGQARSLQELFAGQVSDLQEEYRRLLQQQQGLQAEQIALVESRIAKELQVQSQTTDQLRQTWREMESARQEAMQRVLDQQEKLTSAQGEQGGKLEAYREQGQLFAQQQQQALAAYQQQMNAHLARVEAAFREDVGAAEKRLREDAGRLEQTFLQQLASFREDIGAAEKRLHEDAGRLEQTFLQQLASLRQDVDREVGGLRQQVGSLAEQLKQAEGRASQWERVATEKAAVTSQVEQIITEKAVVTSQVEQIIAALAERGIHLASSEQKEEKSS